MSLRFLPLALSLLATAGCAGGTPQGRVLHVGPRGSDSASGSEPRPWRTLQRALSAVRPGDTVIVGAGTYGRRGTRLSFHRGGTASSPVTVRGASEDSRPRILGHLRIDADHVRLSNLVMDGPTGRVLPPTTTNPRGEEVEVWVRGNDVELRACEVRNDAWHAGVFVTGSDVRILRCHIHDNGDPNDPRGANLDHGIYWDAGSGVVANNLIDSNLAFGVHLYRAPAGVAVVNNTIVRNGRSGVIVSARATRNLIANNIVAFNARPGIAFNLSGVGNRVVGNLFWANGVGALASTKGLETSDNVVADPRFAGERDYRLGPGSPARGRALREFSVTDDLLGAPRPSGKPADLGALQTR